MFFVIHIAKYHPASNMLNTGCPDFCKILAHAESTQNQKILQHPAASNDQKQGNKQKKCAAQVLTEQMAFEEVVPLRCPGFRTHAMALRDPKPPATGSKIGGEGQGSAGEAVSSLGTRMRQDGIGWDRTAASSLSGLSEMGFKASTVTLLLQRTH